MIRITKALVIDDSSVLRDMLSALMSPCCGGIVTASDCAEGRQRLREHRDFTLVLCDVILPDGDGFELLHDPGFGEMMAGRSGQTMAAGGFYGLPALRGYDAGTDARTSENCDVRRICGHDITDQLRRLKKVFDRMAKDLTRYLRGWLGYFGKCETPGVLNGLEQWVRRRLRSAIWKQWKRGAVRFAELRKRGVGSDLAGQTVGSAHGPWRLANSRRVSSVIRSLSSKVAPPMVNNRRWIWSVPP